ncbi:early nodulin-like protein 20 [Humulus lupulus]|uniref:early nodulin-like protein 20 n=1 Tax=Humulus lupulus TaxID=3486 RepID=UPI002B40C115|nr:early nodulin-like protein 20 [Humulus lupulus]
MEKRVMILMILMTIMKFGYGKAELHYVGGGKSSWAPNINFSDWSSQQTFHLGDWLYFGFNKYQYNVLEVKETSYENCIDKDFIKNITKGGRDVFQLTEPKTYYFLSGGGYCFSGMKVAIDVHGDRPTPAPAPTANRSSTAVPPVPSMGHLTTPLLLILVVTSSLVYVDCLQYFS